MLFFCNNILAMTMSSLNHIKQTILIVEDDFSNLILLRMILQDGGFTVLEAHDWETAQNFLQNSQVDLILLDIVLSDIDGYQICKILKKQNKFRDIPVIFITSLDQPFDEEKGFIAGAVDYLRKPINPNILKARISTHLNIKLQREQLETQNLELTQKTQAYKEEVERRRQVEEELLMSYSILEIRVKERTKELREVNREMAVQIKRRQRSERALQKSKMALTNQNAKLEEMNAALKVLLDKRENDQKDFEERIVIQIKQLVDPYIRKLQQSKLSDRQNIQLDILSTNLDEIISPFTRNIFSKLFYKVKSDSSDRLKHNVVDAISTNEAFFFRDSKLLMMRHAVRNPKNHCLIKLPAGKRRNKISTSHQACYVQTFQDDFINKFTEA